ncbi:MAG TPA: ABC transporter substrate-binding protein [Acidimicrobiales bacterium]|nr:ABC transporter substrate-binding protein [Acidimicrobiales bacterium]
MIRRPVLLLVALAAVALPLAACGGSATDGGSSGGGGSGHLRPFKVVLDWTPNTNHAGMYLAKANGWYSDAGLDVTFIEPGEAGSLQALAAGKADVAVSVQEELIPARAAGLPVRSIAAIIQHNTSSLVSLAGDGITRPKDLEGKTYGGYGGQLEQALLDKLVACDGGDPKKVRSVDVGEADYRIGLERNQYDAVWIFDGWDGIRLKQEGVDTSTIPFIDHEDCIPDWYTPLLAASEQVEQERGDDLTAFMAATAKGYQAAMDDPDAASDALLDQADDLDPELVRASAAYLSPRYADDPARWGEQEASVWDGFAAFLLDAGLIDKPIEVGDAWTNEYLPAS